MAAPRPRRQTHMRDPAHLDRRADPVDQLEQRVRPRGETVVHLAAEPAKFTLVSTTGLHDTTNNGHLILPEKIRSPQTVIRWPSHASPSTERLNPAQTLNGK